MSKLTSSVLSIEPQASDAPAAAAAFAMDLNAVSNLFSRTLLSGRVTVRRVVLLSGFLLLSIFSLGRLRRHPPPVVVEHVSAPAWKNIFAFGDSLSSTNFNTEVDMPTPRVPFGQEYPGTTSAGGPNYLGVLHHDYLPASFFFNFAEGGAHVGAYEFNDPDLAPGLSDLTTQVAKFVAKTSQRRALPAWQPDSSLFVVWLGTNDVYGAFLRKFDTWIFDIILDAYFEQLDKLVAAGAEAFLIMTPEPVHLVRLHDFGRPLNQGLRTKLRDWNAKLRNRMKSWQAKRGKRVFFVDVTGLVEDALASGAADPCSAVEDDRPHEECMWEDKFHLGVVPHRLIAEKVAGAMGLSKA